MTPNVATPTDPAGNPCLVTGTGTISVHTGVPEQYGGAIGYQSMTLFDEERLRASECGMDAKAKTGAAAILTTTNPIISLRKHHVSAEAMSGYEGG